MPHAKPKYSAVESEFLSECQKKGLTYWTCTLDGLSSLARQLYPQMHPFSRRALCQKLWFYSERFSCNQPHPPTRCIHNCDLNHHLEAQ